MQFHTLPRRLQYSKGRVCWSLTRADTLVVFVHGFNGSAMKTWGDFPSELNLYSEFRSCDFVFWEYDGVYTQANASGVLLMQFLDYFLHGHEVHIDEFGRPQFRNYRRIIIAAHSLGSVVARRALLDANRLEKPWVDTVKMILFAPAHCGASIAQLILESLTGRLPLIVLAARFVSPIVDDLRPGSRTLSSIENESRALLNRGQGQFTICNRVVWASNDRVIVMDRFGEDRVAEVVAGKSHTSVCKPSVKFAYMQPIDILLSELRN